MTLFVACLAIFRFHCHSPSLCTEPASLSRAQLVLMHTRPQPLVLLDPLSWHFITLIAGGVHANKYACPCCGLDGPKFLKLDALYQHAVSRAMSGAKRTGQAQPPSTLFEDDFLRHGALAQFMEWYPHTHMKVSASFSAHSMLDVRFV